MAMGLFALLSMLLAATNAIAQENQVVFNGLWNVDQLVSTPRVAIVGAGAGGASTAYHLARLAGNAGKNVSITIYDKSNYIGGRSTTVNVFDDERYPVELGASIFVPANRILMQAAEDFGLQTEEIMDEDEDSFGIWDGTQFVYRQNAGSNEYWNIIKLIRKYGLGPVRAERLAKGMVKQFLKIYEKPIYPYTNLTQASSELDLTPLTNVTGATKGIGDLFAHDFIQAMTRVNYAQNLNEIQALESLVCLCTARARAVKGGNWQIFSEMITASGGKLHLNTPVLRIRETKEEGRAAWRVTTRNHSELFDAIVLASPYRFSNISLPSPVPLPAVDYMTLHVTLVATKGAVNPALFNETKPVPVTILTTLPTNLSGAPIFNSVNRVRRLPSGESVYKIFSPKEMTDEILGDFFTGASLDWVYRKTWKAYPKLDPTDTFGPLELYPDSKTAGFWYTSGIESFISTMETSALSGRNIAALIAQKFWKDVEV